MSESRGKYWVTEPNQALDIIVNDVEKPDSDYSKKKPVTIIECLKKSVELFGSRPALAVKKSKEVFYIIIIIILLVII